MRVLWVLQDGVRFTAEYDLFTTVDLIGGFDRAGAEQHLTSFGRIYRTDSVGAGCRVVDASMLEGACLDGVDVQEQVSTFDVVFIRADAPVTEAFRHGLMLLASTERAARPWYVNGPESLLCRGAKVLTCLVEPDQEAIIIGSKDCLERLLANRSQKHWIAKPLDRNSGLDVKLVDIDSSDGVTEIEQLMTTYGFVQLQPYWSEIEDQGESRHFFFDGEPIASWRKIPAAGSHLANRDRGATVDRRVEPAACIHARQIAARVRDLDPDMTLFSVDLVGANLVEINLENVGGLPDADGLFGRSHADEVVARCEAGLRARAKR